MAKEYTAIISKTKTDQHSFLVAIIPAISIPSEYELNEEYIFTELAVIAANHNLPKTNKWAYVHLEQDEKQEIGRALVDACASLNTWYWCNLYEGQIIMSEVKTLHICPRCGGNMIGDGHPVPQHCENAKVAQDAEADSGPWYCDIWAYNAEADLRELLAQAQQELAALKAASSQKPVSCVQRYSVVLRDDTDFPFGPVPGTVLDPEGLRVSYSDYQELHQQNQALKSIIKQMGGLL